MAPLYLKQTVLNVLSNQNPLIEALNLTTGSCAMPNSHPNTIGPTWPPAITWQRPGPSWHTGRTITPPPP